MPHLLELKDVSVSFGKKEVTHGVSLTLDEGEVLGIVGESGSGKSVSMHAVTRLLAQGGSAGGKVLFNTKNGEMIDLLSISDKEMRVHRGTEIGIIFQEPMTSLNPVLTIGNQLSEMLVLHTEMEKEKIKERCLEMLNEVGLVKSEEAREVIEETAMQTSTTMKLTLYSLKISLKSLKTFLLFFRSFSVAPALGPPSRLGWNPGGIGTTFRRNRPRRPRSASRKYHGISHCP